MASKYAAQYIERAKRDVKNFEQACRVLRFDPEKESDFPDFRSLNLSFSLSL